MPHVPGTVLQESCVSPVIVPVAVTAGSPTPRSNMFGLTATELSPTGRPGGVAQPPPVKFVSVTLQFASAADPVFVTVIVTALLPLVSRRAQSLVTVRPGVWHWKFASSNAVACTSPGVGVQSHVTVALSGSAAERVAEHAALFTPDVTTHAPLTHVACALPQSTSATPAPGRGPTLTVPGNPPLFSAIVQLVRSALPALATT